MPETGSNPIGKNRSADDHRSSFEPNTWT